MICRLLRGARIAATDAEETASSKDASGVGKDALFGREGAAAGYAATAYEDDGEAGGSGGNASGLL